MFEKLYALSPIYKQMERVNNDFEAMLPQDSRVSDRLEMSDLGLANQAFYLRTWGKYPVYHNTDVTFFHEPNSMLEHMEERIAGAQKFIFIECFNCEDSVAWKGLMEIVRERAEAGVEVRILYDGTGSKKRRHDKFIEWMGKKKMKCKVFHSRRRRVSLDYFNYRKALIIDGRYAYTGDYEFTNEQFLKESERQEWKVSSVCLTGDAVRTLSQDFLKMWNLTESVSEDPINYLLKTAYRAADGGYVQPFATDPLNPEQIGKIAYMNMIQNARQYIYLVCPEEVRDKDIQRELVAAAKRGVHIYLIHTKGKQKKQSWEISELIRTFQYKAGFLKDRFIVCDDQAAIVGNLHLNQRDIHRRFENACWFGLCRTVLEVKNAFEKLLPYCDERE